MSGFTFRGSPLPSLSWPESRRLGMALQARLLTCLRIRAILKLEPVILWVLLEVEQLTPDDNPIVFGCEVLF